MRGLLNGICILGLTTTFALAQADDAKPAASKAAATPKAAAASDDLPSEATVDSFLHQQFGYQPGLTWKISSIRPSSHAWTGRS